MKTISISVSEDDYEAFRAHAKRSDRSIAELVREAMRLYREQRLQRLERMERLPLFGQNHPLGPLPDRAEIYDEIGSRPW
ncbi:MAG: CopG family transcriptional regulator [Armatimonadetes bacterium]|nr:CopG family transcriptional regulator [Armatimonadota bacterium]